MAAAFLYCEEELSWSPCFGQKHQPHQNYISHSYSSPSSSSSTSLSSSSSPSSHLLNSCTLITVPNSNSVTTTTSIDSTASSYCSSPSLDACVIQCPGLLLEAQDIDFQYELEQLLQKEHLQLHQNYALALLDLTQDLFLARYTSILWMFQIHSTFNLQPHTIALAINYFDRYLSTNLSQIWSNWMFKLLSVSCLSVAAKMEEVYLPSKFSLQVGTILGIDNSSILQKMELLVLQNLEWRLTTITPFSFVDLMLHELKLPKKLHLMLLAKVTMILLRVFLARESLQFPPSILATTSIHIALEEVAPSEIHNFKSNVAKTILRDVDTLFLSSYKMTKELSFSKETELPQ